MYCYKSGRSRCGRPLVRAYTACKQLYEMYFIIFTVYNSDAPPKIASAKENRGFKKASVIAKHKIKHLDGKIGQYCLLPLFYCQHFCIELHYSALLKIIKMSRASIYQKERSPVVVFMTIQAHFVSLLNISPLKIILIWEWQIGKTQT